MCDGFFLFFIILYVGCFAFMSACVVCVPDGLQRPGDSTEHSEAGAIDSSELPCGCREANPGPQ